MSIVKRESETYRSLYLRTELSHTDMRPSTGPLTSRTTFDPWFGRSNLLKDLPFRPAMDETNASQGKRPGGNRPRVSRFENLLLPASVAQCGRLIALHALFLDSAREASGQ